MSGSRDHFTGKLKQELLSALSLLFRQVDTHPVSTNLREECHLVAMPTAFSEPETTNRLASEHHAILPGTHGVTFFWQNPHSVVSLPLITAEVRGEETMLPGCAGAPELTCHTVTFDATNTAVPRNWDPDRQSLNSPANAIETRLKPLHNDGVYEKPIATWQTRVHQRTVEDMAAKIHRLAERAWRLPIARRPVPVHRFSNAEQLILKRQLSEKMKTVPANITLSLVFEYMDMTLFAGVQQGNMGELLCEPKPPTGLPGRDTGHSANFFLVIGTRTDTREVVKTLVPATLIAND
ncbi:MAG: hypothetical protein AB7P76_01425 [Candidatus Melainabacteria bacterium]